MSPALTRLNRLKPSNLSTSFLSHEADTIHVPFTLYPRSASSGGNGGGVQASTIIFIVVGVVCLFVILAGFYLVSRRHAARKAAASVSNPHTQRSPTIHSPSPGDGRNENAHWKIWKTWRPTDSSKAPSTIEVPTLLVPPAPSPSLILPARAATYPLVTPRPSQARRVTSLSVTTSFSHSHITQEALNDFCVSAYDLDGDLETEMLNSARDDIWPGRPIAMEEGRGGVGVEASMETWGNAAHTIDGSVQGCVSVIPATQRNDYESLGAFQHMVAGDNGVEGETVKTVEVGNGWRLLQQ